MDEGYKNLFLAIWKLAVEDEKRKESRRLFYDITERVFPELLLHDRCRRDTYIKCISKVRSKARFKKVFREVRSKARFKKVFREIRAGQERLEGPIKERVYRETLKWPNNDKWKDKEYEASYRLILDEILEEVKIKEAV